MSATRFSPPDVAASLRRAALGRGRRLGTGVLVDASLAVFAVAMLLAMVLTPGRETIPYHLLFLSVTLVYGFRVWPMKPTMLVTAAITVVTGVILYLHFRAGRIDGPELAEVPLMPMMLVAMVWHARRRAAAQRQMETMAHERHKSLEREREFLRDASHAIRTPVTIARGHVELMQAHLREPVTYQDSEVVLRQLDRMCALSARLLALARLDSAQPLRVETVDLDEFVQGTVGNWAGTADREWVVERSVESGGAGVVRVRADCEWLELAVDALVENAVHFTGPGDRIELACRYDAATGTGTVAVTDTGAGIAAEDLPHVFDRFWHRRPPDGLPGSGLGLAMALAAAEAMGGSLSVTSTPGKGSCFRLALPPAP